MRKSRVTLTDVDDETINDFFTGVKLRNIDLLNVFEALSVPAPNWAKMLMVASQRSRSVISFFLFESSIDFINSYTKMMLIFGESLDVASFAFEETDGKNEWKIYHPPTLIGLNLRTKIR